MDYLFADDTSILYANENIRILETVVNTELKKLHDWLASNKLSLNIQKTNFIIFHPYQKHLNYQPTIEVFDIDAETYTPIQNKNYVKYLGILIDKNLTWKHHIDHISTRISKTVGLLAKLRHHIPFHTLLKIYQSLILPYISYGITVWGQASNTLFTKILLLQKRALRLMHFAHRNKHAVPLFVETKVLPINFLYFKSVINLMHDIYTKTAPPNILNMFKEISTVHTYNTRSSVKKNFYILNKPNLEKARRSIPILGAKLWNEIPSSVRELTKKGFKQKITSILYDILKDKDEYQIEVSRIATEIKLRI